MEDRKERNEPWLSVPQFGDWDQKGQVPDYSLDFSKIREMRKQNKRDVSRASLGNEEELISSTTSSSKPSKIDTLHPDRNQDNSPTRRRSIFSYFNCCVKA
ncbi:Elongation factor 1-delta 1-like [Heracleum sosnowskyi]|uniref:Elongation factor 1-delta 1-like n=1 Tax=Heracleum sosnowskyi TaxID=360622 RepID=A0AAD8JHX4_9APIA|nr:Elongation factor 1-delta 1-like [Heracleum sosnowskyi]